MALLGRGRFGLGLYFVVYGTESVLLMVMYFLVAYLTPGVLWDSKELHYSRVSFLPSLQPSSFPRVIPLHFGKVWSSIRCY